MTAQTNNETTLAVRVQWKAPVYTACLTAGAVSLSPSEKGAISRKLPIAFSDSLFLKKQMKLFLEILIQKLLN